MKKSRWFIVAAFIMAWTLEIIACMFALSGNQLAYQIILMVTMFTPLVALVITRNSLKGMGWHLPLKKHLKWILAAWFMPAILTILGAVVYYLIFPSHFDSNGSYIAAILGSEGMALLEEQGVSIHVYMLTQLISALLYAPILNMFLGVGEEVGWRGYLYPNLKEELGVTRGRIVGGVIWGIWHWPLIALVGYEYGSTYLGFPFTGMLVFCVFTCVIGILLDYIYEKTQSIWVPAIGHGALNAIAALPLLYLHVDKINYMILGPVPMGLIAMIPSLILVIYISYKQSKGTTE